MNLRYFLIIFWFIPGFTCFSQDVAEPSVIQRVSIGASFNAVADEAVLGIEFNVESDLWKWNNGVFYMGLSGFYGTFPNTNEKINRFIKGKTSLIQPIQLQLGHLFIILNRRLLFRTSLSAGPSFFLQKIEFNDNENNLYGTYKYSKFAFTAQSKIGVAVRIGERNNLEIFTNLSIINTKIAPMGLGLGMSRVLKPSAAKNKRH